MNKKQKAEQRRSRRLKNRKIEKDLAEARDLAEEGTEVPEAPEVPNEPEAETVEKDYYPEAMPMGPTSWDEMDAMKQAREQAEHVRHATWDTQDMVYNILGHPEMNPKQKAEAMKAVADGFGTRVSEMMGEHEKMMKKDMDVLIIESILAHDKRHSKPLEFIGNWISKAVLTAAAEDKLSDDQFALVVERDGKKVRKYPIHNRCLHGKTKIPLLDGTSATIMDLVGREVWVYAFDATQKSIVPALAKNIRKTVENEEMVEIFLDNGESVFCTLDHRFLLRNGSYREAQDLRPGDSIMPLYRKEVLLRGKKPYEQIYQPWYRFWEWTHHLVHREYYQTPLQDGNVIHHINENHFDNCPTNLEQMTRSAHCALHGEKSEWPFLKKLAEASRKRWQRSGERERQSSIMRVENDARKRDGRMSIIGKKISDSKLGPLAVDDKLVREIWDKYIDGASYTQLEKEYKVSRPTMQKHFERLGLPRKKEVEKFNNHKVVDIKYCGNHDGYDMEVPHFNNFAIDAGVFVHNSHVRNALARAAQMMEKGGDAAADAKAALPKIRAAAKRMGIEMSMEKDRNAIVIEKDVNGDWRWVGWVSNNFIDWDGDIISEAAHTEYVDWLEKNADMYPLSTTWHMPQMVRSNPVDFATYENGFLIMSGKLTEDEAECLLKAKTLTDLGMSHGTFVLARDPNDRRVITKYRMYECSDLPLENAANPFTDFEIVSKEAEMDKAKYLAAFFGGDEGKADAFLEKTGLKQKALEDAGVESKEKGAEVPEESKALEVPAVTETKTPDVAALLEAVKKELGADELSAVISKLQEDAEKIPMLEALVKNLQGNRDDQLAEMLTPPASKYSWMQGARASQDKETVLKENDETDAKLKSKAPGVPEGYWLSEITGTAPVEQQ